MQQLHHLLRLLPNPKAKDSEIPAAAFLLLYLLLITASFISLHAGSMTAFWDIRNSFSDLWDSIYYACQKSGYTYFHILYPPLSSLVFKLFGTVISGCHEVFSSRGFTLIIYGAIFFLILIISYFLFYRSLLIRSFRNFSGWQVVELCALTWMLPPSLFGLTRMNTSMLLVPICMYMFLSVRLELMSNVYICLALLPFIKPFFLIPGVLYLFYSLKPSNALKMLIAYLPCFFVVNMLVFSFLGYSGSYYTWLENMRLFSSASGANPIALYYSYQPMTTNYLAHSFFVGAFLVHPWLATPYRFLAYSSAFATLCFALYVGVHIIQTGFNLYSSIPLVRDRYVTLLFSFLASSYVFQFFSTSIGPYCLSLMTPVLAALFLLVDVAKYRFICCLLVACSLLPLFPLEILAFTPKFPTIFLFDCILLLVSRDVRKLVNHSALTD